MKPLQRIRTNKKDFNRYSVLKLDDIISDAQIKINNDLEVIIKTSETNDEPNYKYGESTIEENSENRAKFKLAESKSR